MLPPTPEIASQNLDLDGFNSTFERLWNKLERRFFKFERLQSYQEPDDPSYQAFVQGDLDAAVQHLEDRIASQAALYKELTRKNLGFVRVRAVEIPLSKYLLYELKSYRISARYGEKILIVDITSKDSELKSDLWNASDFLLFDDVALLVHKYNDKGFLQGGWLVNNSEYVETYVKLANASITISIPLGVFERQFSLS